MFTELPYFFYCINYIIKEALEELITINKGERIKNYKIFKKNRKIKFFFSMILLHSLS